MERYSRTFGIWQSCPPHILWCAESSSMGKVDKSAYKCRSLLGGKECEHGIFLFEVQMLEYLGWSWQWSGDRKRPQSSKWSSPCWQGNCGVTHSQNESLRSRGKALLSRGKACPRHCVCWTQKSQETQQVNLIRCKRGHLESLSLEPHVTYGDIWSYRHMLPPRGQRHTGEYRDVWPRDGTQ